MATVVRYSLHQATLDNGLRVIVNPDVTVPVVALNLWYDVGSRDERPGRTGLAHLFEHLMFEGSAQVGPGEHLAAIQSVGGSANATTWFDRTNYFETVPTGALDLALWLEAERLASLDVTQHNLDNQRDVVMEEKRQRYDNVPYGDVLIHLVQLTFPADHPYGHATIGSMDDLAAATLDDARAFFATHYAPNNAVLTLVGDVHPDDALERVRRAFERLPRAGTPTRAETLPLPPLAAVPRRTVSAAVPSDATYLTWRLPTRDTPAFDAVEVALSVLGDGQTSRLHRRLVRADRIAEGAGASATGLIGGTSIGFAHARALPEVGAERLEEAIVAELARFIADGPTTAEVDRVKAQYERMWLGELARFDSRADLFSCYATLHGDPDAVNRRLDEVRALTVGQVAEAAAAWLAPDQRAVLTYRKAPA
ncbi:M16 family metallopeptidase [Micropruina sp.]|uniref:M16 family metallopeptidase n=1 Tax=Micropruina sp. TaxID=2737536 RepID=UPI0039E4C902